MSPGSRTERWLGPGLLLLGLLVFGLVVLRSAWVADDAYITFRSIDQLLHGQGLRWNVLERVQVFTHPLWMLLLTGLCAFWNQPYQASIGLSLICAVGAVGLVLGALARRHESCWSAGVALIWLMNSKAVVDFSASGLENPLTFLMIAGFGHTYLGSEQAERALPRLTLIAGLAMLNRLDTIVFFGPALLALLLRPTPGRGRALLLGCLPVVSWLVFSTFYFGFPFPNTAYTRLAMDFPVRELIARGVGYLLNGLENEPLLLVVVLVASCASALSWRRDPRPALLMLGVLGYLGYVLRIGGDFMSGRFLAAPLFAAVLAGLAALPALTRPWAIGLAGLGLVGGLLNPRGPLRVGSDYDHRIWDDRAIADERGYYYQTTGLLPLVMRRGSPLQSGAERVHPERVVVMNNVGMDGYASGRGLHIVDRMGLTDPLLARLPLRSDGHWRVGHIERPIPEGYLESLQSGQNLIEDSALRDYCAHLWLVTRGPLWSGERLQAIWQLNTGQLDGYLADWARAQTEGQP